jgi:hypothetical protein
MRIAIIGLALAMAVLGCKGRERGTSGDTTIRSADTNVSNRTVKDTAIVRSDTTVRTDTVHKMGGMDTTKSKAGKKRP